MAQEEKITLQTDTGEAVDFYVLEETRINGMNYLLVTDSEDEDEDGECYIFMATAAVIFFHRPCTASNRSRAPRITSTSGEAARDRSPHTL